ncbi:hypothetical protein BU17DRAFT_92035 [Hysterangium stoloniferum]|nr:hypothetical protein BU17DRAFT_92035 [Hysterangium stoloniferum]
MEITLFYREFAKYTPSAIAKSALLLARFTGGKQSHSHELTLRPLQKNIFSPSIHSQASTHILQFYLEGRRFVRQPLPIVPPITPFHGHDQRPADRQFLACLAPPFRRTPAAPELKRVRESQFLSQVRDTRLLEEEYRYDILGYMHDMEQCTMSFATSMDQQPEIRWHMRACLVDFLVEVHLIFGLRP